MHDILYSERELSVGGVKFSLCSQSISYHEY